MNLVDENLWHEYQIRIFKGMQPYLVPFSFIILRDKNYVWRYEN